MGDQRFNAEDAKDAEEGLGWRKNSTCKSGKG